MSVTIYHNPRCSKSRTTLALLQENNVEPVVVEYLNTPPTAKELKNIISLLGIAPRGLLRGKEAKEAGLDDPSLSDDALIAAMVANPIVIERPIVVSGGRAKIGRPPEGVLEIL
jgi:arsenate reductase